LFGKSKGIIVERTARHENERVGTTSEITIEGSISNCSRCTWNMETKYTA